MRKFIANLVLIIAILVISYPFISRHFLSTVNEDLQKSFYATQESVSEEEKERIDKEKEKYNKRLLDGAFNLAGDIEDLELPRVRTLTEDLNPLGILYIPKLNEEMLIYAGTSDEVLAAGVGIIKNTSMPGGMGSHSVISGHRGTHNANIFKDLDKMEVGDDFYIIFNKDLLKYTIEDLKIVEPQEASVLTVYPDKDLVTLLTCTPYLVNTERLLLEGHRSEITDKDKEFLAENFSVEKMNQKELEKFKDVKSFTKQIKGAEQKAYLFTGIFGVCLIFVLNIIPLFFRKKKKNSEEEQ